MVMMMVPSSSISCNPFFSKFSEAQALRFMLHQAPITLERQPVFLNKSMKIGLLIKQSPQVCKCGTAWSFMGGLKFIPYPVAKFTFRRKISTSASLFSSNTQIASAAFTWGTVGVLPFYSLMVLAPNAKLTRMVVESNVPYVVLGILYAFLLYLAWSPDTLRLMFASKYWLPELPGISRMFTNQMTVASAWIHLLAVDLFAARQVFLDGLKSNTETRHSISLCLLFCPIGILVHVITKILTKRARVH